MSLESQFVEALSGLLYTAATAGIAVITPKIKNFIHAHTQEKTAAVASNAIDGLAKIADSVVADFNQRIVTDIKAKQAWSPEFAEQVKKDAMAAVKSQGSSFIQLLNKTEADVEPLISTLIEHAVSKGK
ncbi:hypothetical protein HPT25_20340 [Bacillus sp. BRMEA1]|uniref:hypothetical protein n=1 Tax=Neobacillus endophyticus TaxID=2738405 RepID=UPI001565559F|nr:hypothetical protein [Neobacillus endophyticus]NRD79714.1 hypothetical protein [Neobacillus endophyticus]